jgi:hypothetical protein
MAKLTNLTFSKRIQELEMGSNQVSDQKENFKSFGKQGVLEKFKLFESDKTGNLLMGTIIIRGNIICKNMKLKLL